MRNFWSIYILPENQRVQIYSPQSQQRIAELTQVSEPTLEPKQLLENLHRLHDIHFIFTGWGGPRLDKQILDHLPNLKAVFYGAGSIRGIVTDAFWERNIPICSAWQANAIPVAKYTVGQILLALKLAHRYASEMKKKIRNPKFQIPGTYRTTVGLIALGAIGKLVAKYLQPFDLQVIAYDPYVSNEVTNQLGVTMVDQLESIFQQSHVVSLHAPNIEANHRMIRGYHFEMMRPWSTFINTARGILIDEEEMIEVLRRRKDITAILDVTYPEPPQENSPLYELENVILTPHIAGSQGQECYLMGEYMVQELERFLNNQPFQYQITYERFQVMA